eukprot:846165-Pyramimonas_sp.AAC.1
MRVLLGHHRRPSATLPFFGFAQLLLGELAVYKQPPSFRADGATYKNDRMRLHVAQWARRIPDYAPDEMGAHRLHARGLSSI